MQVMVKISETIIILKYICHTVTFGVTATLLEKIHHSQWGVVATQLILEFDNGLNDVHQYINITDVQLKTPLKYDAFN